MSVLELEKPEQKEQSLEDQSVKDTVLGLLDRLPDDVTWERLEYHLYVLKAIWEGDQDSKAGRVISDSEMRQRMQRWFK